MGLTERIKNASDSVQRRYKERQERIANQVSRLFSKAGFSSVTAHGLRKMHSTYNYHSIHHIFRYIS